MDFRKYTPVSTSATIYVQNENDAEGWAIAFLYFFLFPNLEYALHNFDLSNVIWLVSSFSWLFAIL